MYKLVLTHEVMPGRLPDVVKWFEDTDAARRKDNPSYKPPLRYITVFGSVNQLVVELESDAIPELVYAEAEHNKDLLSLIVPGRTTMHVLKRLEVK